MAVPAHTKGDRLDQVVVGQQMHVAPFTLTTPAPSTGWRTVSAVANDGALVTVTFDDASTFTCSVAQLVRFGWA